MDSERPVEMAKKLAKGNGEMGFYVGLTNPALFHNEVEGMISSLLESGNHSTGWDKQWAQRYR